MIRVDLALDARAAIGEGALWSPARRRLLWVDIHAGEVHALDPETGRDDAWDVGLPVGCVAEGADGRIVCALTDGFSALSTGDGALERLGGPAPGAHGHRFNDGTVDPLGRFLAGTMPLGGASADDATGTLHAFDGRTSREIMAGFHCQNGLAFSPDGRTAYVSDSFVDVRTIFAHDHDPETGAWGARRVFFDTRAVAGRPDGASVDADGCYWMAGVGGWELVRLTPEGRVDRRIALPVERPTRPAFGGPDLSTLYVTSIGPGRDGAIDPDQPWAGGVLAVTGTGAVGLPSPVMAL